MDSSRDAAIAKQYNTVEAAQGYAEGYHDGGPEERFYRSRVTLVCQVLDDVPGGDLLDVGCGPGMMIKTLLDTRPGDFRITAVDQSEPMVRACVRRGGGADNVRGVVGRAECMPLSSNSFDVVLAMGVLEYCEIDAALSDIARVTRRGGLVLMSMLNPLSPYRFVEWHILPLVKRTARTLSTAVGGEAKLRHGPSDNGIQAYSEHVFHDMAENVGLHIESAPAFDINYILPPLDRVVHRHLTGWKRHPERTIGWDWRRHFGSAYMAIARKDQV